MRYAVLKGECHIEFGTNLGKVVAYFLTTPIISLIAALLLVY